MASWGDHDEAGTGKLTVIVSAQGFTGTSSAWFDRRSVLEFSDRLARYPMPDDGSASLSGGFLDDIPQEHVGLAVLPVGPRGQVGVRAHLATAVRPDTRVGERHEAKIELLTTYQRLGVFSSDLRS